MGKKRAEKRNRKKEAEKVACPLFPSLLALTNKGRSS
jgi:hypothetical protein